MYEGYIQQNPIGVTIWWGVIYFVINLILRSILAGMIWEVFIVISENKSEINMKEV